MEVSVEPKQAVNGVIYPFHCHETGRDGPGRLAGAHLHNYIELLYCTQGCAELLIGESVCRFTPGDLALINSHEVHSVEAIDPGRTHYLVLKFEPELLFSAEQSVFELRYMLPFVLRQTPYEKVISARALEGSGIPELLYDTLAEYEKKDYGFEMAIRANACRVFLWILRRWHAMQPEAAWGADLDSETAARLQRVMSYVEENYAQPFAMSDVADRLHMGYSSFSRFFYKYTCRSFADYVNSVRIQKAEFLLATTDMNVTEIAMATGFSSASYFIQRFREANAVTPKRFRARFTQRAGGAQGE